MGISRAGFRRQGDFADAKYASHLDSTGKPSLDRNTKGTTGVPVELHAKRKISTKRGMYYIGPHAGSCAFAFAH